MTRYTTSTTVTAPGDGTYAVGCWGGGAGGGSGLAGNGAGGGAFSFASVPVTAGQVLTLTIGAGGAIGAGGGTTTVAIGATTKCSALGGNAAGAGGAATGVGTTRFAGGAGGAGDTYFDPVDSITYRAQGGGGGAAGRGGAGGNGGDGDALNGIGGTAGLGNTSYAGTNFDGGNGGDADLFTAPVAPGGGGRGATAGASGAVELVFTAAAEVAPVITPATANYSTPENTAWSQDFDADNPVTWSISAGTDAAKFTIDANGLLSLPAKNYEAPDDSNADRVYACTIRAANVSNGLATTKAITVTITDVVDETPPTITTSATQTCPENQQLAVALTADETVTWSIVAGNDAAQFQIASGVLQWAANGTKDYETPQDSDADNAYLVTVRATDTSGNATTKLITVTVTDVTGGDIVNTGLKLPTAGADTGSGGTFAWTTPNNVVADDAAYAVAASSTASVTSNVLTATGFDLSAIPDGASIVGIEVVYEAQGTSGSGSKTTTPSVSIKGLGTQKSGTVVTRTTALAVYTLGGPADVWGLSGANLTGAGLKSAFAVNMQAAVSSGTGATSFQVDYIKVRVYYVAPIALTANDAVVASPANGTPLLGQVHGLGATSTAVGSPVLATPALGQAHALVANNLTTAAPVPGNRVPDGGFEAGLPAVSHLNDGGGVGLYLITGSAHGGNNHLRADPVGGHIFMVDNATFVAAGRSALLSVWVKDSGIAGSWAAGAGGPDVPAPLSVYLTTVSPAAYNSGTPWSWTGTQLDAAPAAGQGWTKYTQVVTGLTPGATYYVALQPNGWSGQRQVDIDDLLVTDVSLGQVHGLIANSTATSSPALGTPVLGQKHVLVANSVTPSSPVVGTPTMGQIYALGANSTTTGPPVLGTPAVTQTTFALTANSTTTSSPALGTPALGQKHALSVNGTTTASPAVGTPALGQAHALTATPTTTSAPALGTPAIGQKHALTANSTAPAFPTMATPVLGVILTELVKVHPASVVSAGGWTDNTGGSAIAEALDEAVPDDADYARSPTSPADNVLRLKLAPMNARALYQTATLRYRVGRQGVAARTQTVRLYQGATLIAGPWVHNADAVTQYSQAIDPALITDGDDLYVEVEAD